jgi:hypothetical protein
MGISSGMGSNLSLEAAEPVLQKAIELGCTFWDTAVRQNENLDKSTALDSDWMLCFRSHIGKVRTKSCLETSSRRTMSVISSSVSTHNFH